MLQIRHPRVAELAERLATLQHSTKTEAVLRALENEYARLEQTKPLSERLRPLQERIAALPKSGLTADKAFFDWLSGEDDA